MSDTADSIHATLMQRCQQLGDLLEPVVHDVVDELAQALRSQVGLTDHDLQQLATLGHPYKRWIGTVMPDALRRGKRHWKSKGLLTRGVPRAERLQRQGSLGHDLSKVHVQSGTLYVNIYTKVERTPESIVGVVGIDPAQVPWLKWIVKGTRWMIPRDIFGRTKLIARPRVYAVVREGMNDVAQQLHLSA
jgi:hypothetical protein